MISSISSSRSPGVRLLTYIGFAAFVIGVTLATMTNMRLLFMVVGAVIFVTLAWRRPDVAVMIVFASAPFQTDLTGSSAYEVATGKFSVAEATLALTFLVFLVQIVARRKS